MRNYRHIEVRPIAGALGAEIAGVDMAQDLDAEVVSEVRHALLEHLVIFLRDQKASEPAAHTKRQVNSGLTWCCHRNSSNGRLSFSVQPLMQAVWATEV